MTPVCMLLLDSLQLPKCKTFLKVSRPNSQIYVLVITCLRGMLLVYGHETGGRVAPEGGVSINRNIPIRHVL